MAGASRIPLLLACLALPCRAGTATYQAAVAPILERSCTKCHGPEKQKAGLRLDSHAAVLRGSKDGLVVSPGDPEDSEIVRRVGLPPGDDDLMPSGDRPPLSPLEIATIRAWIASGAPENAPFDTAAGAPRAGPAPAAPDYRPRLAEAEALARSLGVALVPRSRVPTDGLILRTAGAPARCDDAVLAKLAPFGDLIVEAELARTRLTDKALPIVGSWANLQRLDLTRTDVTAGGVTCLASLHRLEALNLTETRVGKGVPELSSKLPQVRRIWAFQGP